MGDSKDTTARDALARSLAARQLLCSHDELRVLDALLGRLELGRERYGHLNLSKVRDWEREEAEELLDVRIYQACATIARRDEQLARLRCEAADEIAARVEPGLRELRDADVVTAPSLKFDLGGES